VIFKAVKYASHLSKSKTLFVQSDSLKSIKENIQLHVKPINHRSYSSEAYNAGIISLPSSSSAFDVDLLYM